MVLFICYHILKTGNEDFDLGVQSRHILKPILLDSPPGLHRLIFLSIIFTYKRIQKPSIIFGMTDNLREKKDTTVF